MKATELMLGGWVRRRWTCTDTGREVVRDFQITEIRRNGKTLYTWGKSGNMGRVEELEPIPLTIEILEKNGFVARVAYSQKKWHICIYNDFYRRIDDDGDITLNVYSERKKEWRLSIDTDRNERTVVYIRFVHELQNAFRLCRIDKSITI